MSGQEQSPSGTEAKLDPQSLSHRHCRRSIIGGRRAFELCNNNLVCKNFSVKKTIFARKQAPGAERLRGARRGGGRVGRTPWRVAAIRSILLLLLVQRGGGQQQQQHRPPFPLFPNRQHGVVETPCFFRGRAWLCIPPASPLAVWPRASLSVARVTGSIHLHVAAVDPEDQVSSFPRGGRTRRGRAVRCGVVLMPDGD